MNELKRRQIVIEYYVWEPFNKKVQEDEDNLLSLKKEGKLLPHAGYITIKFNQLGAPSNDLSNLQ